MEYALRASALALAGFLVLTTFDDDEAVVEGLRAGARGYLLKDVSLSELVDAIRAVAAGRTAIQPVVTERVVRGLGVADPRFPRLEPADPLTDREIEVLRLIVGGATNAEVGVALSLSEKTVESHLRRLFDRYGVLSRTELTVLAIEEGWLAVATRGPR